MSLLKVSQSAKGWLRTKTHAEDGAVETADNSTSIRLSRKTKMEVANDSKHTTKAAKIATRVSWQDKVRSSTVLNEHAAKKFSTTLSTDNIHRTHERWAIRDIVFCGKCGYWMQLRSKSLKTECVNKPPHNNAKYNLGRMKKGLHPLPSARWDDGVMASAVFPPVRLD